MPQTCAVLRIAEVRKCSAAVTTPARVYKKGPRLSWMSDDDLRVIASRVAPQSVRKVSIADEPGRMALLA